MDTLGIFWLVFWSVALVVVVVAMRRGWTLPSFSAIKKRRNNYNSDSTESEIVGNVAEIQDRHCEGVIPAPSEKGSNSVNYEASNHNPKDSLQHSKASITGAGHPSQSQKTRR